MSYSLHASNPVMPCVQAHVLISFLLDFGLPTPLPFPCSLVLTSWYRSCESMGGETYRLWDFIAVCLSCRFQRLWPESQRSQQEGISVLWGSPPLACPPAWCWGCRVKRGSSDECPGVFCCLLASHASACCMHASNQLFVAIKLGACLCHGISPVIVTVNSSTSCCWTGHHRQTCMYMALTTSHA